MPTHLEQKPGPISIAIAVSMYLSMFLTLGLCVHQGHCPLFLPTISDTWVYFPETNISRFVVGNVSMLMGVVQFVIYWIDTQKSSPKWGNQVLTALSFVACCGLAGVGSVCDNSRVPDCLGNGGWHGTFAAIFFAGYNIQMVARSLIGSKWAAAACAEVGVAAASLALKARFVRGFPGGWGGFPTGPVVEWVDVALICIWTAMYVQRRGGFLRLCVLDRTGKGDEPTPLAPFFSMAALAALTTVLFIGTIAATAVIYYEQGRWPAGGWPYISSLWTHPPGNWISRWSVVAAATIAAFCHVCAYYLRVDGAGKGSSLPMTALACVAMLGVSVVGCVDGSENGAVHVVGAVTFFAGYDIFMVLSSLGLLAAGDVPLAGACAALASVVSVASKARFLPTAADWAPAAGDVDPSWGPMLGGTVGALLEWADALAIIAFFVMYVAADGAAARNIGLAVIRAPSEPVDNDEEAEGVLA